MTIEVPRTCVSRSAHIILSDLHYLATRQRHIPRELLLDLSNLEFLDAEGANFLALIPFLLGRLGVRVRVILPRASNVVAFLGRLGILDHYHQRCIVEGPAGQHVPRYERTVEIDGKQVPLIARAGYTYIIEPHGLPDMFLRYRQLFMSVRSHMYALGESVARSCCAALHEIASNIFDHSGESAGCLTAQFTAAPRGARSKLLGQFFLAVSDLGIGIKDSLAERWEASDKPDFSRFEPWQYIEYAVTAGVSRYGLGVRGMGLHHATRLASKTRITSGNGILHVDSKKGTKVGKNIEFTPGTSVLMVFDVPEGPPERHVRSSPSMGEL